MNNKFKKIFRDYQEISIRYDAKHFAVWCYCNPRPRPCFTPSMLIELRQWLNSVTDYFEKINSESDSAIRYLVLRSQISNVFNMGGDLNLISNLIRERNRKKLLEYAIQCIDVCYLYSVNLHAPLTTICLVEGTALGGGFECALSANILIATENAEMGFPEIRFNLFPGMGAYSFLVRSCGTKNAEKIIAEGQTYSASDLHKMGIINHVGKVDRGVETVQNFMAQHHQSGNGHRALQQVKQCCNPISYKELVDITNIWVDAALSLDENNLRLIDRLVHTQSYKMTRFDKKIPLRTAQDRRFNTKNLVFPISDWSGNSILFDRRNNFDRRLPSVPCS
jgi:DSF synthase